jgi:L-cysteine/cystine lyase
MSYPSSRTVKEEMGSSDRVGDCRRELNLPDGIIAVNAGSWGPLCRAAREAVQRGYEEEAKARGDDPEAMREARSGLTRYSEVIEAAKDELSEFLNCSPDELALCDSSTTGMNIFLWGYDFEPGDEIVAGSLENPAATVPLRVLAGRRGVKLTYVDLGNGDVDATEALSESISSKTRMILISHVDYATGACVDLKSISELAPDEDVLLLVDGIQAVGTVPVDVSALGVDGYAVSRHKFLCGPDGAGVLFVRKEVQSEIHPTYTGVFSASGHGMTGELTLMETAQKYEVSTRPLPVIMGGTAAVRWVRGEVDLPYIFDRVKRLYGTLWRMLSDIDGVRVISQPDQSSLLTFAVEGVPAEKVVSRLREDYIFTRTISVTEPVGVRISIGFWNRASDLDRIAEVVRSIADGSG